MNKKLLQCIVQSILHEYARERETETQEAKTPTRLHHFIHAAAN